MTLGSLVLIAVLVASAAVCAYFVFDVSARLNPVMAALLALALLIGAVLVGTRSFANHRKVSVVVSSRPIAAGNAIKANSVETIMISRDQAHGYLRDTVDAVGRFASRALAIGDKLTAADVSGVAVGRRAFAIVVDDNVTLSATFSAGERVDLAFAAAKDVRPTVVRSVPVVERDDSPARLVISLNDFQTRRVLEVLGRTRLVVTKAIVYSR